MGNFHHLCINIYQMGLFIDESNYTHHLIILFPDMMHRLLSAVCYHFILYSIQLSFLLARTIEKIAAIETVLTEKTADMWQNVFCLVCVPKLQWISFIYPFI